jgi:hypothetical protein
MPAILAPRPLMRRFNLSACFLALGILCRPASAQLSWSLHGQAGWTAFVGDYRPGPWRPGLGVGWMLRIVPDGWIGAEWAWVPFEARARGAQLARHPNLAPRVQASPLYAGVLGRWSPAVMQWSGGKPVLEAGLGALFLDPRDGDGLRLRQRPETRAPGESYGVVELALPLRAGVSWQLHGSWSMALLGELFLPLSDYWDNTSRLANPRTNDGLWGLRLRLSYERRAPPVKGSIPAREDRESATLWTVRIVTLSNPGQAAQVRSFLQANGWEVEWLEKPDPVHGRLWVIFFGRYERREAGEPDRARIEALLNGSPYFRLDPNPPEVVLLRTLRAVRNQ